MQRSETQGSPKIKPPGQMLNTIFQTGYPVHWVQSLLPCVLIISLIQEDDGGTTVDYGDEYQDMNTQKLTF